MDTKHAIIQDPPTPVKGHILRYTLLTTYTLMVTALGYVFHTRRGDHKMALYKTPITPPAASTAVVCVLVFQGLWVIYQFMPARFARSYQCKMQTREAIAIPLLVGWAFEAFWGAVVFFSAPVVLEPTLLLVSGIALNIAMFRLSFIRSPNYVDFAATWSISINASRLTLQFCISAVVTAKFYADIPVLSSGPLTLLCALLYGAITIISLIVTTTLLDVPYSVNFFFVGLGLAAYHSKPVEGETEDEARRRNVLRMVIVGCACVLFVGVVNAVRRRRRAKAAAKAEAERQPLLVAQNGNGVV